MEPLNIELTMFYKQSCLSPFRIFRTTVVHKGYKTVGAFRVFYGSMLVQVGNPRTT